MELGVTQEGTKSEGRSFLSIQSRNALFTYKVFNSFCAALSLNGIFSICCIVFDEIVVFVWRTSRAGFCY